MKLQIKLAEAIDESHKAKYCIMSECQTFILCYSKWMWVKICKAFVRELFILAFGICANIPVALVI